MKSFALLLFFFMAPTLTLAEYRVYQYYIKAKHPYGVDQEPYLVTSTLSPQGYLAYHGGGASLQIDLLRTWMCYGDTSYKETCAPPLSIDEQEIEKQQADLES